MSDTAGFVVVYRYHYWDEEQHQMVVSPREATLECIRNGLGIAIVESGRKVHFSQLDEHGRVVDPVAPPAPAQAPTRGQTR
jgi:hypothetical protein